MYQDVNVMKSIGAPIIEAYSLFAIQDHFYKVKMQQINEEAKTEKEILAINENYEDILYFFEVLYERDYNEASYFLSIMSDQSKEIAYKYLDKFHVSLTQASAKEMEHNFVLFKSIMYAV